MVVFIGEMNWGRVYEDRASKHPNTINHVAETRPNAALVAFSRPWSGHWARSRSARFPLL